MRQLTVQNYEAGQRLDRYLTRYMQEASKSFIYKMLRKKNITLNGKKADGTEKLEAGDEIKLFLAEETIIKFQGANPTPTPTQAVSEGKPAPASAPSRANAPGKIPAGTSATSPVQEGVRLQVIYEDGDVIFINKPAGMLSQKAKPEDVSVCEHLIDRMIRKGELTQEALRTFKPGVCNRLDRNTSGIIAAGKSIRGLQALSARFRDRSLEKYYLCLVAGEVKAPRRIRGYLVKDEKTNTVTIRQTPGGDPIDCISPLTPQRRANTTNISPDPPAPMPEKTPRHPRMRFMTADIRRPKAMKRRMLQWSPMKPFMNLPIA